MICVLFACLRFSVIFCFGSLKDECVHTQTSPLRHRNEQQGEITSLTHKYPSTSYPAVLSWIAHGDHFVLFCNKGNDKIKWMYV